MVQPRVAFHGQPVVACVASVIRREDHVTRMTGPKTKPRRVWQDGAPLQAAKRVSPRNRVAHGSQKSHAPRTIPTTRGIPGMRSIHANPATPATRSRGRPEIPPTPEHRGTPESLETPATRSPGNPENPSTLKGQNPVTLMRREIPASRVIQTPPAALFAPRARCAHGHAPLRQEHDGDRVHWRSDHRLALRLVRRTPNTLGFRHCLRRCR
jgi:hypothetical protein